MLERDGWACVQCGEEENLQAHHVKPISRYPELAFELDNLLTLCQPCNLERGDDDPDDVRLPWLHPAFVELHDLVFGNVVREAQPVTLVCGPPCSGKSTLVADRSRPGDLVLDLDDLAVQAGSPVSHGHHWKYVKQADRVLRQRCQEVADGHYRDRRVWVVRSLPDAEERAAWAEWLEADVVLLNPERDLLEARALDRPDPDATLEAIAQWYEGGGSSEPILPTPKASPFSRGESPKNPGVLL